MNCLPEFHGDFRPESDELESEKYKINICSTYRNIIIEM